MERPDPHGTTRAAILDRDREFGDRLCLLARKLGWKATTLAELPRPETLRALRLDVLLVDVAAIEGGIARLSHRTREMPGVNIIVSSRASTPAQRVLGLQAGLDGWIDKDCHPHETLARIQAIARTRHGRQAMTPAPVRIGDLHVDATRYDAMAGERSAGLTTREFEVFALLVENRGRVLGREHIHAGVWGSQAPRGDRSVDIFISRIRLKLRRISPDWLYLHTHVGSGYRLQAQHDPAAIANPTAETLTPAMADSPDAIDAELTEMVQRTSHAHRRRTREADPTHNPTRKRDLVPA